MRTLHTTLAMVGGLVAAAPSLAQATPNRSFEKIALTGESPSNESGQVFDTVFSPAMNSGLDAAFRADTIAGSTILEGVFRASWDGLSYSVREIASKGDQADEWQSRIYQGRFDSGPFTVGFSEPLINNNGLVGYVA